MNITRRNWRKEQPKRLASELYGEMALLARQDGRYQDAADYRRMQSEARQREAQS